MTMMTSQVELDAPLPSPYCPTRIPAEDEARVAEIKQLLKANNAVLVAHYYTDDAIQQLGKNLERKSIYKNEKKKIKKK